VGGLTRAGAYDLSHPARKSSRQRWLAVNPALGSSDLKPLDEAAQEELFGTLNVMRLPYAEVGGQFTRNREVLPVIAVLVFVAFAVEALVGAWQSRRRLRPGAKPQASEPTEVAA
jgi:hypothetical protein